VETAIFLPLFIIATLTLGWLIQMAAVSENVYHALADETRRYAADVPRSFMAGAYSGDVVSRVKSDGNGAVASVKAQPALVHVPLVSASSGRAYTDLIGASVSYKAKLGIPQIFSSGLTGSETAVSRVFVGASNAGNKMPFSDMEKDKDSHVVWVFPRAGERYHGEDCSYIKNKPREVILTGAVRSRYKPCKLCKPGNAKEGSLVYVFPSTGDAYHIGKCHSVERYVISMSEDDAKGQRYTKCAKCGGK
jgi:hypothetical protein